MTILPAEGEKKPDDQWRRRTSVTVNQSDHNPSGLLVTGHQRSTHRRLVSSQKDSAWSTVCRLSVVNWKKKKEKENLEASQRLRKQSGKLQRTAERAQSSHERALWKLKVINNISITENPGANMHLCFLKPHKYLFFFKYNYYYLSHLEIESLVWGTVKMILHNVGLLDKWLPSLLKSLYFSAIILQDKKLFPVNCLMW